MEIKRKVEHVQSDAVRSEWRQMQNSAEHQNTDIVVLRYGKPSTVLISYAKYVEAFGEPSNENKDSK